MYSTLEPIDDVTAARPDALTTIIPFKKLLLKPRFVMMAGDLRGTAEETTDDDAGPQVFFGAHACDIHALKILDILYLSDHIDPYHARNRENLTVVGYGCWPDEQGYRFRGRTICTSRGDEIAVDRYREIIQEYSVDHSSAKHAHLRSGGAYVVGAISRLQLWGNGLRGRARESFTTLFPAAAEDTILRNNWASWSSSCTVLNGPSSCATSSLHPPAQTAARVGIRPTPDAAWRRSRFPGEH